ncbi:dTDP-glucose 4,6-dehydratase [Prochlorococcus marinus str. MIT 9321]|uniref:UDP-glucuronate decarboxylase n=1 Tax=Prochlorococcus marinus str. MIT 9401 TaxID=167551 RepID=A0A0A2B941_PROMR|nr:UDP-glucuronic acid decarboxylase family protein [Prochlorococcus marinus]KGG02886.1 dTDP-glucose 4,6-dehydratase [Prochlorococcus marinus str. MIT 9321]KGG05509.1 dTDP-glucose 4,6-dehydratase [Prochlorococcus marinus str. MIT 9322]KGG10543.1 dTDP-glucose 4,6-dehydratase [Prochlorococcus marinus str. MIT 9401]
MEGYNTTVNLVTGGAGFLGSHLIDRLMNKGEQVICLDNFFTGTKDNLLKWNNNPNFELIRHDITKPITLEVNKIWHLACPASPIHYQFNPIKTAKTSFLGTYNMLGMAKRVGAKFFLASTSEIYGDPEIHPQPETYRGNVNPIGVRSCYDEGKRIAETLTFDYKRSHDLEIKVARIFNTYGPRMLPNDGRVISNLIMQGLSSESMTLYGDGCQTRSFCYVNDLIEGFIRLMDSRESGPLNLGNPNEITIIDLARLISKKLNIKEKFIFKELPQDDPLQRKPIIQKAQEKLNWDPKIDLDSGLEKTIAYFKTIKN